MKLKDLCMIIMPPQDVFSQVKNYSVGRNSEQGVIELMKQKPSYNSLTVTILQLYVPLAVPNEAKIMTVFKRFLEHSLHLSLVKQANSSASKLTSLA